MDKQYILKSLRVGQRVAEEEKDELAAYFVETDQWRKIQNNEVDIVYGSKGTGKSALYALLINKSAAFAERGIVLIPAENPLGATVFRDVLENPPSSEQSFSHLWKLYVVVLVAADLRKAGIKNDMADSLIDALQTAGLLPVRFTLSSLFNASKDYVSRFFDRSPAEVEHVLSFDSNSGMPVSIARKVAYEESGTPKLRELPVDELLAFANDALTDQGLQSWILFDRLDVAFASSPTFERIALRSLFMVYADCRAHAAIRIKLFVRDDVWRRISEGGFREASHITKTTIINWDRNGLLNLVASRLASNDVLCSYYGKTAEEIRSSLAVQEGLIEYIFPEKVDTGKNPKAFEWIVSRVKDGSGKTAPREVIHMLECLRDAQLEKLERGENIPEGTLLFDRVVFKVALATVSKVRYEQTFCPEYPELKPYTEMMKDAKSEQTVATLAHIWQVPAEQSGSIAEKLVQAGFFELRGDKKNPSYWVPFLYRDALSLVQGKAVLTKQGELHFEDVDEDD